MNFARDVLFDLLCNATVEVALFALAAALLAPLLKRLRPAKQHVALLGVLVLCLVAPVANTLRHSDPAAARPQILTATAAGSLTEAARTSWLWPGGLQDDGASLHRRTEAKTLLLAVWLSLTLYGLIRFGRGLLRVHDLRRASRPLPQAYAPGARLASLAPVLQAERLEMPVTLGVWRPVIIVPSKLLAEMGEDDLLAVIAHESAHIARKDYLVHLITEVLTLPIAWHPGARYLATRISLTRELACDAQAAARLGKRRLYARALLHLSRLCVDLTNSNAMQMGFYNSDNLEERIDMLTTKSRTLSQPALAGVLFTVGLTFGSGAVLARATSLQTAQQAVSVQSFAGTWHFMLRGQSFATLILKPTADGLSGTVTQTKISLANDGSLDMADAVPGAAPSEISEAKVVDSILHVTTKDGFAFSVKLTDSTHAAIQPVGAPSNMQPILAQRAN